MKVVNFPKHALDQRRLIVIFFAKYQKQLFFKVLLTHYIFFPVAQTKLIIFIIYASDAWN